MTSVIRGDDGETATAPVDGIDKLVVGVLGNLLRIVLYTTPGIRNEPVNKLAIRAPSNNDRNFVLAFRAVEIDVNLDAVAHLNRDIPFDHHPLIPEYLVLKRGNLLTGVYLKAALLGRYAGNKGCNGCDPLNFCFPALVPRRGWSVTGALDFGLPSGGLHSRSRHRRDSAQRSILQNLSAIHSTL